jgi:hypothetical protein
VVVASAMTRVLGFNRCSWAVSLGEFVLTGEFFAWLRRPLRVA